MTSILTRWSRLAVVMPLTIAIVACGGSATSATPSVPATSAASIGSGAPSASQAPGGPVLVPGTSISMIPQGAFVAATSFAGFADPGGAAIEVTTVPQPYDVIAPQVTAAELATEGISVDTRDTVTLADGRPAILVSGTQTIDGVDTQKIILVTGDDSTTAFVTANIPFTSLDDVEPNALRMLLSARFGGGG